MTRSEITSSEPIFGALPERSCFVYMATEVSVLILTLRCTDPIVNSPIYEESTDAEYIRG